MWKKKLPPPDNLDYDLTPRIVPNISDYYQICAAVERINELKESMFLSISLRELIQVLKDCDIKHDQVVRYNDKRPTYIHQSWIELNLDHPLLARVTLLQSEVLSKEYFGISPLMLKRSRVGTNPPTEKQTSLLNGFITNPHILGIEKDRLQAVLDEDSVTKSRASLLIGYFIGNNSKHRLGRSDGVLGKRAKSIKTKAGA